MQWVYEPGSFRPLAQVEAQGDSTQLHYIVTDLTGTARELCSEEGEVRWRGEQGLWGVHREERRPIPLRRYLGDAANEEVYCELRYQGQLFDAETGLYYNRHRYYDAESGQYLSPDPIGLAGGLRPQGYVHNPLEWVDPLGLTKAGCDGENSPENSKKPDPSAGGHFSGTEKPRVTGATPNSMYTHIDPKTGKAVQNAIYDGNGDVIGHVDFKNHGIESGHYHLFPEPGNPASGHGPGKPHYPHSGIPSG